MNDPLTPRDEDDLLAAEYVIGLLDAGKRQTVRLRAQTDVDFATRIAVWETSLEELNEDYGTQVPPKQVKARVDQRLFGTTRESWFSWFSMGLATAVLLLGVVLFQYAQPSNLDLQARLESTETGYVFDVSVDRAGDKVDLALRMGEPLSDGVFELWLIPEGSAAPQSLGTFASDDVLTIAATEALAANATLAISLEPLGGSPTGAPTGPVLAVGVLKNV
ncbi:MAG: anti-sigma factor [Pseudomonadota bacterium]